MKTKYYLYVMFAALTIALTLTTAYGQRHYGQRGAKTAFKNRIGIEFVYIPAGSFMMGSNNGWDYEKPVHKVTIGKGFYMGKYEVTQAQWQQIMERDPDSDCDQCPVGAVSWNNAQNFIRKLNAMNDGYVYKLPTEAEWEYACRAGTTSDSVSNLDSIAWYRENSGNLGTHPVGQKQPNALGLYDMLGNVWELCEDVWHSDYKGAPTDGSAWLSGGDSKYRVWRGGSRLMDSYFLSYTYRCGQVPGSRNCGDRFFGLRLVAVSQSR